jgi:hypothetical protein
MADITNVFVGGKMDKDLDERLIQEGVYRNALNIDVDTDENSNVGSARNSLGNTIKTDLAALFGVDNINARTIGAVTYDADNLIYWIITGDFDAVIEHNTITGITTRVLACTDDTLNFNGNYIITGINYINGFLYWTDDLNPPRKINISRAKGYSIDDARIADDISVIIAPPLNPPTLRLFNDTTTQANNISEKFLSFSYRYKYIDGQYSAMSPLSAVSFSPKAYVYDYASGHNKAMINKFNTVDITFNTGKRNVTDIQVLMHDEMSSNISVVETFNKKKLAFGDGLHKTLTFNNNKTYTILTSDQLTRTFDNVPLHAKAQDFVGSRLMYGNYTQFYNVVNKNNDSINIKINLTSVSEGVSSESPKSTFRSDRDYEIAIEYMDDYGRHTTALTSAYFTNANTTNTSNNTVYIPATQSDTANSLIASVYNQPPVWASSYRLLIKQNKKEYYNIFPILYYIDGLYRHFLIAESDRDKFAVGGYVIFKSTTGGPTYSNKQYKILQLKNQPSDFLGYVGSEAAGLYFTIKVDAISELTNANQFNYASTGIGGSSVVPALVAPRYPSIPVLNETYIDIPIYYGSGNSNGIIVDPANTIFTPEAPNYNDERISIVITTPTTYTVFKNSIGIGIYANTSQVLGTPNQPITYLGTANPGYYFWIKFMQSAYTVGDRWVFNCRSSENSFLAYNWHPIAIVPGKENDNWSPSSPEIDRKILPNAVIRIQVVEDTFNPNNSSQGMQQFTPDSSAYDNIEEWWYESGARNQFSYFDVYGNDIKGSFVRFRRGHDWELSTGSNATFETNSIETSQAYPGPVRMCIVSSMPPNPGPNSSFAANLYDGQGNNQSKFQVSFEITQTDTATICETVAKESPLDLYHETAHTYPIVNGKHVVVWSYLDYTAPTYASGKTNLGQLNPGSAITSSDMEHWFTVGDMVYVLWNNNPIHALTGMYTITYIPDAYNIVIDLPFPGIGAATPGKVSFSSVDVNQLNFISQPAVIKINNPNTVNSTFNGWCFGNGLESDRIYDDFNATELQYSPRVNAIVDDYKERHSYNAICYSGIYGQNTGVNRLNEFNLSIANFKYLHSEFGTIQKLYARDTDLLVFQENKVSNVKYEKNLLYDAVGGSQVASIPQVLGTQVAYPGDFGISNNPESFAEWGDNVYWTDARRGSVLEMTSDQIVPISSIGMTGYFRNNMMDSPNTQKLGGYDPHTRKYVLASNDTSIISCDTLNLSRYSLSVPKTVALEELFTIIYSSSWTISKVDNGSGTSWLTITTPVGSGSQDIYGLIQPNTGATRSMKVRVTYCSRIYKDFILTQASGKRIKLIVLVSNNSTAIK